MGTGKPLLMSFAIRAERPHALPRELDEVADESGKRGPMGELLILDLASLRLTDRCLNLGG
jgi:hypothetical protein